jgi:hypothetical protein
MRRRRSGMRDTAVKFERSLSYCIIDVHQLLRYSAPSEFGTVVQKTSREI